MNQASKVLVVALVAAFGLWGCAQGNGTQAERIKSMENKVAKLEEDYKAVTIARDTLRKKLTTLEEERAKMQQDLDAHKVLAQERETIVKERDDLVKTLGARTTERDTIQTQLEQVRKGLRNLLGQTEAGVGAPAPPSISAAPDAASGKS
jgi:uncharacterized coiled-coil DUF342 family protein